MNILLQEIEKTIEAYRSCWARLDFSGLKQLWDATEGTPCYLPEEAPNALTGWAQIEEYWAGTRSVTRSIEIQTSSLQVQPLAPDLAAALFEMRWVGEFAGYASPIGGDTRVSAIFRRCNGDWKFIHYVEAPLAPIAYFRRFYERFGSDRPARG